MRHPGLRRVRAALAILRRSAFALAAASSLVLAACSSAPPVRVHTLMAGESPLPAAGAAAQPALVVVLEPVSVPAQVDPPQWLVRLPDDSLAVLEQERWASPLRDELRQALLEVLVVRYGVVDARAAGPGAVPLRVGVDVRRFDSIPGREARIEGSWTIVATDSRASGSRCEWLFREAAAGGMPALAAAHRRAVARLGDALGDNLVRLRRGEAPMCPARDPPL